MRKTGLYRALRKYVARSAGVVGFGVALGAALAVASSFTAVGAQQATGGAVAVDADDIGGVVTGPRGPEAGVWVIAETRDLPTRPHQDRRDRRPRTIPRAGSAEGHLRRVGARLRADRFDQGQSARRARR